jgi:hypothetical protein
MRCSECYEANPAWQDLCSRCGKPTLALRLCPNGHLLPPKVTDCPVCPSMWPNAGPFSGPSILRGVLWADAGRLRQEDRDEVLSIVELRDSARPHAFRIEGSDCLRKVENDPGSAAVQVLVRPEGVFACVGPEYRKPRASVEFDPFPVSGALRVGPILIRIAVFDVPDWVPEELEQRAR